jgi:hypothetical protein
MSTESTNVTTAKRQGGVSAVAQAIGGLLVAVGGPQLLTTWAPPTDNIGMTRILVFGLSAIAWLVALVLADLWRRNEARKHRVKRRVIAAAVASVVLLLVGGGYLIEWDVFTVPFDNSRVVIGTVLTSQGKKHFDTHPTDSPKDAVWAAGGTAEDVWTIGSINAKRIELISLYLVAIFCCVFSVTFLYYNILQTGWAPAEIA